MAEDKFKLPGTSYEELVKIIHAYSQLDKEASPGEVGRIAGKAETEVSRNNGFLVSFDIIAGPPRGRRITDEGRQLARAIEHDLKDEVVRYWRLLSERNEFVQKVVSAVRVRRGMDRSTLLSHIVYTAGQKKSPQSAAGANCLLEIMSLATLISEEDGKFVAAKPAPSHEPEISTLRTNVTPGAALGEAPAISYGLPGLTTGFTYEPVTRPSGVPMEIRLDITVQCSVEDLATLAPKLRQLVAELTAPRTDTDDQTE